MNQKTFPKDLMSSTKRFWDLSRDIMLRSLILFVTSLSLMIRRNLLNSMNLSESMSYRKWNYLLNLMNKNSKMLFLHSEAWFLIFIWEEESRFLNWEHKWILYTSVSTIIHIKSPNKCYKADSSTFLRISSNKEVLILSLIARKQC